MEIGITQKMAARCYISRGFPSMEADPFFCWDMDLISLKRKDAVLITNVQTRFSMVMMHLDDEDYDHLEEMVKEAVSEAMKRCSFDEEVIDACFRAAGAFRKSGTHNRKVQGSMKEFAYYIGYHKIESRSRYQIEMSRFLQHMALENRKIGVPEMTPKAIATPLDFFTAELRKHKLIEDWKMPDREYLKTVLKDPDLVPYEKEPLNEHLGWIEFRLPDSIPERIRSEVLRFEGMYRTGKKIYSSGENGEEDVLEFASESEEEIRMFEYDLAADNAARLMALRSRNKDRRKWRWNREYAKSGRWMYSEREEYVYDAVYDERLAWFELYLSFLKDAVSTEWYTKKMLECTALLNRSYQKLHWSYDEDQQKFIEVSHSRELDVFGNEEPSEDCILKKM